MNKALDAFEQSRSVKNSTKILSDCTAKERALSARIHALATKLRKEVADKTNAEQQANKSYANGEVILRGNAKAVKKALEKLLDNNNDSEIEVKIFDFA